MSSLPTEAVILHAKCAESLYFIFMTMRGIDDIAYVYIMANDWQRLYVGVTSSIEQRITQHKEGRFANSFTSRYHLHKLAYFERFTTITAAIAREKKIKNWHRIRKLEMIVQENPAWKDLSADWGKPTAPFDEEDFERKRRLNTGILRPADAE